MKCQCAAKRRGVMRTAIIFPSPNVAPTQARPHQSVEHGNEAVNLTHGGHPTCVSCRCLTQERCNASVSLSSGTGSESRATRR